jgi:hypothetical protein
MLDSDAVAELVEQDLAQITDAAVASRIRSLLIVPTVVEREWDYGDEATTYPCWTVMEHRASNTGIAYCEDGFGPASPWGLVFLSGEYMSIGMDAAWYPRLEDAFRESMAFELPATGDCDSRGH